MGEESILMILMDFHIHRNCLSLEDERAAKIVFSDIHGGSKEIVPPCYRQTIIQPDRGKSI